MVKQAINPTSKLDKVYLDATPLTCEEVKELAITIRDIVGTQPGEGDLELYLYDNAPESQEQGKYLNILAANIGEDTSNCAITVTYGDTGDEISYTILSTDFDYGGFVFTGGHWYDMNEMVEISGQIEIDVNSTESGKEIDVHGKAISLENNELLKKYLYIIGTDPEPTLEEDPRFRTYISRLKKFITNMMPVK